MSKRILYKLVLCLADYVQYKLCTKPNPAHKRDSIQVNYNLQSTQPSVKKYK